MRPIATALAGLALMLPGATVSAHAAATPAPHKTILATEQGDNFVFSPRKLTILLGTKVTWSNPANDAQIGHNLKSDTKSWHFAKDLASGDSISYRFKAPGVYRYECTLHPGMTGKITVTK